MRPVREPFSAAERAARIRRAMAFDMRDVLARYMKDTGVSQELARAHERELKRFLLVCALNDDGKPIGMAGPVDELWHAFILSSRKYQEFCAQAAGRFLHHHPTAPGVDRIASRGYAHFQASYAEIFGSPPPGDYWPVLTDASSSTAPKPICELDGPCNHHPVPCNNRNPEPEPQGGCTGSDEDEDDDEDTEDDEDKDSDIDGL